LEKAAASADSLPRMKTSAPKSAQSPKGEAAAEHTMPASQERYAIVVQYSFFNTLIF
jgi:hypothetical protein